MLMGFISFENLMTLVKLLIILSKLLEYPQIVGLFTPNWTHLYIWGRIFKNIYEFVSAYDFFTMDQKDLKIKKYLSDQVHGLISIES